MQILRVPKLLFKAVFQILRSPKLLYLCVAPWLIGVLSFFITLFLILQKKEFFEDFFDYYLPAWLEFIDSPLVYIFTFLFSSLLALLLVLVIGSVFLEKISTYVLGLKSEKFLEVRERKSHLVKSITTDIVLIFLVIVFEFSALILGFFPILSFISIIISMFILGITAFDSPFATLGLSFSKRVSILKSNFFSVLTLGAIYWVLMLIIFGGVLFAPIATIIASEIVSENLD